MPSRMKLKNIIRWASVLIPLGGASLTTVILLVSDHNADTNASFRTALTVEAGAPVVTEQPGDGALTSGERAALAVEREDRLQALAEYDVIVYSWDVFDDPVSNFPTPQEAFHRLIVENPNVDVVMRTPAFFTPHRWRERAENYATARSILESERGTTSLVEPFVFSPAEEALYDAAAPWPSERISYPGEFGFEWWTALSPYLGRTNGTDPATSLPDTGAISGRDYVVDLTDEAAVAAVKAVLEDQIESRFAGADVWIAFDPVTFPLTVSLSGAYAANQIGDLDLDQDGVPHPGDSGETLPWKNAVVEICRFIRSEIDGAHVLAVGSASYSSIELIAEIDGTILENFPAIFGGYANALNPGFPVNVWAFDDGYQTSAPLVLLDYGTPPSGAWAISAATGFPFLAAYDAETGVVPDPPDPTGLLAPVSPATYDAGTVTREFANGTLTLSSLGPTSFSISSTEDFAIVGLGGGGWLESAAIAGDVWLLGSDTSGIYRSEDGGVTFELANDGLGDQESLCRFVTDIEVDGTDFLIATGGGVYRAPVAGGAWVHETPPASGYIWEHDEGWGIMEDAIPFSVVEVDGSYLAAGAGNNRWNWDSRRAELYPLDVYTSATFGVHSLWEDTGAGWAPVASFTSATGTPEHVIDLEVRTIGLGRVYVVSTRNNLWLKVGASAWESIATDGVTVPSGGAWWDLEVTADGHVYGALLHDINAATAESAIYVYNLNDPDPSWELVNGGSLVPALSYGNSEGVGQCAWIGLWEGAGADPDTLLAGYRAGYNVQALRAIADPDDPGSVVWNYALTNGTTFGWNTIWGNNEIIDFETRAGGGVLSQPNSVAVKSSDYGVSWESVSQEAVAGGFFRTSGYRQLCVFDIAWTENGIGEIPAGSLIYSSADVGIAYTNGADWTVAKWLEVPFDLTPGDNDEGVTWDRGSGALEVRANWLGGDDDALFFIAGEGNWGVEKSDCRLMVYGDEDLDGTAEFRAITKSLSLDHQYAVTAFATVSDTKVIFGAGLHTAPPSDGGTFLANYILSATFNEETDVWTVGAGESYANPPRYFTDCVVSRAGRIFISGADGSTTTGGVWYRDVGTGSWTKTTNTTIGYDVKSLAVSHGGEWLFAGTRGSSSASVGGVYLSTNAESASPTWSRIANDSTADFGVTVPEIGGDLYDGTDLDAAGNITTIEDIAVTPGDSTTVYLANTGMVNPIMPWCGAWRLVVGGDPEKIVGTEDLSVRAIKIFDGRLVLGYQCADIQFITLEKVTAAAP